MKTLARSPRLSIALPDGLMKALERWAEAEGNKPTSLATFLLEREIRLAVEQGKVPLERNSPNEGEDLQTVQSLLFQVLASEWSGSTHPVEAFAEDAVMDLDRVQAILNGDRPTDDDIIALTRMIPDWTEADLRALVKRQYNGNGDRKRQPARK